MIKDANFKIFSKWSTENIIHRKVTHWELARVGWGKTRYVKIEFFLELMHHIDRKKNKNYIPSTNFCTMELSKVVNCALW